VSRIGTGCWQRQILTLLEEHVAFFPIDLLGLRSTPSERAALRRAVRELHAARKIGLARWCGRHPSGGRTVVFRAETLAPHPSEIVRLDVKHQCYT
jgi:hypothetical protein